MKATIDISGVNEKWEKEDLFCPSCGKQKVWVADGDGDYYVGPKYLCTNCNAKFYLPSSVLDAKNGDILRIVALKNVKC